MGASKLDAVYRSLLITKFFTKGWGKPENLRRLFEFRKIISNREECYKLIPPNYPVTITKEEKRSDSYIMEGHFLTPMELLLPGVVPRCAQQAHFQIIMPNEWPESDYKPMCIHLAGTGDHFFWRRRNLMAKPLLKEGCIGAVILENPFYGLRKPKDQVRSSLHNVSDIFVMGGCLVLESLVLLHWCEQNGLGPLGVTGLSMGGHMASLAATNWPKPLVLVPCLSWSTASAVFTQGVMSNSINWDLLETQFFSDGEYKDKLAKMVTIVDDAFIAGRKFAQRFTSSKSTHVINFPKGSKNSNAKNSKFDITNNNDNKDSSFNGNGEKPTNCYDEPNNNIVQVETIKKSVDPLVMLKKNQLISDELYSKITSKQRFELDNREIFEINELAFQSLNSKLNASKNNDTPVNSIETTNVNTPTVKNTSKIDNTNIKKSDNKVISNGIANVLSNLPFITKQKEEVDIKMKNREALQFMRGVMDECTHLGNFSVPYDTSLIIAVCAKHDAYVPRGNPGSLEEIWPGAEIRYIDAGHVSAYVLHQNLFRSCIIEAFEKSKKKWSENCKTTSASQMS